MKSRSTVSSSRIATVPADPSGRFFSTLPSVSSPWVRKHSPPKLAFTTEISAHRAEAGGRPQPQRRTRSIRIDVRRDGGRAAEALAEGAAALGRLRVAHDCARRRWAIRTGGA